jgi:hypothetical protein
MAIAIAIDTLLLAIINKEVKESLPYILFLVLEVPLI